MADLDRDLQNGDVLPLLYKADRDRDAAQLEQRKAALKRSGDGVSSEV